MTGRTGASVFAAIAGEPGLQPPIRLHPATFRSVAAAMEQRAMRTGVGGIVLHRPPVPGAAVTVIAEDMPPRVERTAWPDSADDEWFLVVTGVDYPLVLSGRGTGRDEALEARLSTEPRVARHAADVALQILARSLPDQPPLPRVAPSPTGLCDSLVAMLLHRLDESERRSAVSDHEILNAVEADRARMAHHLHDGPVQELTAALLFLDGATQMHDTPDPSLLARGTDALRGAIVSCRAMMDTLSPAFADIDELPNRVERLVDGLGKAAAGATVAVESADRLRLEDRETVLDVYRIVEALLDNVRRHAAGALTDVRVTRSTQEIVMVTADRGPGGVSDLPTTGASGLALAQRRVQRHGGTLTIESSSAGTTVTARLPLRRAGDP